MVQKEVHEYLRSGTEKGFSLKELKRELIKAGHEIKVVEQEAREFERKNAFKIISVFGIVIVVSLVVIFGFKGFIFGNEKNVVGVNLENNNVNSVISSCSNGNIKDCSAFGVTGFQVCQNNMYSECIKNNFDSCPLNGKNSILCCVRNSKLIDCGNEQYFSKNEYVVFKINLKNLIGNKINDKFYKECTYSYIREKYIDRMEKREYCTNNIESDKGFSIELKGFLPEHNNIDLININILSSYSELNKDSINNNVTPLYKYGVRFK